VPITHRTLECDILVAGGGPAGVPCAIAAARLGAKVILCHDRPVLGGNASSEVRMHIVGADHSGRRGEELATEAREGGIIEEIRLESSVRNPQRSPSMLDLILYDLCKAEPNLTVMLNTTVVGATVAHGRITTAKATRQSTEDSFTIHAKIFIDCTGDGRLGVEAVAAFMEGRESKAQFGESLAQGLADNQRLGSTLLFMARKHDTPMPFVAPTWARKITEADLVHRPHATQYVDGNLEYGYWWIEWGGTLDTIKHNEAIRDELLAIVMGVWNHVKNGDPTAANYPNPASHGATHWALDWFGFLPGKRESRRFIGQHVLTENDVMGGAAFEDAIAYGGWPIDTHPPAGVDAPDEQPCTQLHVPHLYDIPLRACVARDVSNLMFAGRNISATHIAFASTRVMATCAAVGQGVGTAAAIALQRGIDVSRITSDMHVMQAVQQRLLRDDSSLIGVSNKDANDLARLATITASSQQSNGEAMNVLTGQTRCLHGTAAARPGRVAAGTHRWMSDPDAGLPAWLELRWAAPVCIRHVELIFDTGMHRVLTLSMSDFYTERMKYGSPQPETVRDFKVLASDGDTWTEIASVTGNYKRRVRLALPTTTASAIRINVAATNGLDHARICEVRAYSQ
jgi:hypothetical protein